MLPSVAIAHVDGFPLESKFHKKAICSSYFLLYRNELGLAGFGGAFGECITFPVVRVVEAVEA